MPKQTPILTFVVAGKEYRAKMLTPATTKALLKPYSAELGHLAAAWNQLQHNLSSLFTLLVTRENTPISQAIWHATESDFTQRKMLRAVVDVDQAQMPARRMLTPIQAEEILWVLNEIDAKLRHKRNNAIHAPLVTITGVWDGAVRHRVEAHFNPHNPRAKPLRGKNLIDEFRTYAAQANALASYVMKICLAVQRPQHISLPDRPASPQAHKTRGKPRRGKRKSPDTLASSQA